MSEPTGPFEFMREFLYSLPFFFPRTISSQNSGDGERSIGLDDVSVFILKSHDSKRFLSSAAVSLMVRHMVRNRTVKLEALIHH